MAKSFLEKMGLEPVEKLNKTICLHRSKYLKRKIKAGDFSGRLLKQARYYASWYGWLGRGKGHRAKA